MTEEERVTSVKEAAGRRAADLVETGTIVGLGTGSTVWFTLVRLAERIKTEGLEIVGVPTSTDTMTKATELGIPVVGLGEVEKIHWGLPDPSRVEGDQEAVRSAFLAVIDRIENKVDEWLREIQPE